MRLLKVRKGVFGDAEPEVKLVVTIEFPEDQIDIMRELCEIASVSAEIKKNRDWGTAFSKGFTRLMKEAKEKDNK